jgi:hypothetical protein
MGQLLSQFAIMRKSLYQIDQKSYFLCNDATVYHVEHTLQENEGKRIRQKGKSQIK